MFCNDCCKFSCPRKSVDITYCDQKLTYVQAGILEQPDIIEISNAHIDYGEGESKTAKTMKIISKDVQTILDKAREEFLNDIFRLDQPERKNYEGKRSNRKIK